jgi:hypothetical protein
MGLHAITARGRILVLQVVDGKPVVLAEKGSAKADSKNFFIGKKSDLSNAIAERNCYLSL